MVICFYMCVIGVIKKLDLVIYGKYNLRILSSYYVVLNYFYGFIKYNGYRWVYFELYVVNIICCGYYNLLWFCCEVCFLLVVNVDVVDLL